MWGVQTLPKLLWGVTLLTVTTRPGMADSCGPVRRELSAPVQLSWTDTAPGCRVDWVFGTTVGQGITIDFHFVFLAKGDVVNIYDTNGKAEDDLMWDMSYNELDAAPIIIPNNQAVFSFTPKMMHGKEKISTFNVSVGTIAGNAIPVMFKKTSRMAKEGSSKYVYDCSSVTEVPEILWCDRVKQCIRGEDERNCDYLHPGCGDWVPYKAQCLLIVHVVVQQHFMKAMYETTPAISEKTCREKYQAELARFPLEEDKEFLAGLLRRSALNTVTVNLQKLKTISRKTHHLYRYMWQWGGKGGVVAFEQHALQREGMDSNCVIMEFTGSRFISVPQNCYSTFLPPDAYVCSKPNSRLNATATRTVSIVNLPTPSRSVDQFPTNKCSDGSLVHTLHSCPLIGNQSSLTPVQGNSGPSTSPSDCGSKCLPVFPCKYGEGVHYSLTCDGHLDCVDGSDENDCQAPVLEPILKETFVCSNRQLVPKANLCNGVPDCVDRSDEDDCRVCNNGMIHCQYVGCIPGSYTKHLDSCKITFILVDWNFMEDKYDGQIDPDGFGRIRWTPMNASSPCPETHYRCPGSFCIPTYWLANGERDCAGGEDEDVNIQRSVCPGFYRCRQTLNCVHPDFVCDGIPHCPKGDDEIFCDFVCPGNCSCEGQAFTCQEMFDWDQHLLIRYLDLSKVPEPHIVDINKLEYLHFVNLSFCELTHVNLTGLRNLRVLDLSRNRLSNFSHLYLDNLDQILHLDVSNNPLTGYIDARFNFLLKTANAAKLETLHMRSMSIKHLEPGAFDYCKSLVALDLSGNTIETFSLDVFDGLDALRLLKTDNPRLCCPLAAALSARCEAPTDELSSCTDLLRSVFFRVFLWVFAVLAITGNAGVLVYRLVVEKTKSFHSYRVLVMTLSASDLLMGVYLAIIGVADASYQGRYVALDFDWRHSPACKLAGALAFTSCEVSAFLLCLITVDRVLAICFPLQSNLRLTRTSTYLGCAAAFGVGVALALTPLLPPTRHWQFYSQTGICLPLPITRVTFPGQEYSFNVFIVLNFVLFLVVGAGQMAILRVVRGTSTAVRANRTDRESAIARRLLVVALTDFCCWFPVGLLGLLAAGGVRIPDEVNVWSAVFVLPVNAALNPFLYTVNTALDRWRRAREDLRQQRLVKKVQAEVDRWPEERVQALVRYCLQRRLAGRHVDDLSKRPVPSGLPIVCHTDDTAVSFPPLPVPPTPTPPTAAGKY